MLLSQSFVFHVASLKLWLGLCNRSIQYVNSKWGDKGKKTNQHWLKGKKNSGLYLYILECDLVSVKQLNKNLKLSQVCFMFYNNLKIIRQHLRWIMWWYLSYVWIHPRSGEASSTFIKVKQDFGNKKETELPYVFSFCHTCESFII